MYKILVPTDFSPAAGVAVKFAFELSKNFNEAELTIFHTIEVSDVGSGVVHEVEDILIKEAEAELKSTAKMIAGNTTTGVHVQYDLVMGSFSEEIKKKCRGKEADLIIMGTKGAGGIEKIMLGSNATRVMEETTECPVLVIPENTPISPIKRIVYASDLEGLKDEAAIVIAFAKLLNAHVDILHITENKEELQDIDPIKKAYELVLQHNYSAISFNQAYSLDILEGIESYVHETKAGMVAMFSRRKSFFERLFDKSYTREMAFHTHTPLLSIPYELVLI
jgi:nucleotide-binding universal stress UspA family protein